MKKNLYLIVKNDNGDYEKKKVEIEENSLPDSLDENHFNKQMNMYKNVSFYETDITPQYGDKLLTLSTCEYSNEHGRLVIVARRVVE